ncbi:hypothetical protein [endosymbiont GvMRE of Glomus versiforme]|uniref:hypothetical protein n=1 Tax=endosymbiont GvMRE of Glomus versiforme TaxID=2039283 RepID=UPI000EDFDAE4|nr:hypothetical protein [endosymbiont GvMRE of Glomus versiforme]RHZ36194.1 hypothetical protein GvMRE_Ic2g97 [endosymbiont GvMRE of Glomus versiforme]
MTQKQLNSHPNQDFVCDNCQRKFHQTTAYSPQLGGFLTETYCSNCIELAEEKPKKQPIKRKKTKDFGTPPLEVSENLRSLEIDKRTLRKTGRTKQFNTGVSEEWLKKLKSIAYKERLHYNELLEKALKCYEKHRGK